VTIVRMYVRCPRCKFQAELNEHGRIACLFCNYEIDINRGS